MAKAAANGPADGHAPAPAERPTCGIVMPISAIDDCPVSHWADVLEILTEAAGAAGFTARLVSAADYQAVILGEIVQNLYNDPIVVCDVSARNPNVMFELGMRLAFDMPTIVIKDDKTEYAFDASPIEHLGYPRDLRYQAINEFKQSLANKMKATHERATKKDYKSFLKHFGQFKVSTLETTEVSGQQYFMKELNALKSMMRELIVRERASWGSPSKAPSKRDPIRVRITGLAPQEERTFINRVQTIPEVQPVPFGVEGAVELFVEADSIRDTQSIVEDIKSIVRKMNQDSRIRLLLE